MLTPNQIRKMAKPISDSSILNGPTAVGPLTITEQLWGNAHFIIFAPAPAKLPQWVENETAENRPKELRDEFQNSEHVDIFPVFLGGAVEHDEIDIQFIDRHETTTLANARYISTMIKKAGKHRDAIQWTRFLCDGAPAIAAQLPTGPVAILAATRNATCDAYEWTLRNPDLPRNEPLPQPASIDLATAHQPGLI